LLESNGARFVRFGLDQAHDGPMDINRVSQAGVLLGPPALRRNFGRRGLAARRVRTIVV